MVTTQTTNLLQIQLKYFGGCRSGQSFGPYFSTKKARKMQAFFK